VPYFIVLAPGYLFCHFPKRQLDRETIRFRRRVQKVSTETKKHQPKKRHRKSLKSYYSVVIDVGIPESIYLVGRNLLYSVHLHFTLFDLSQICKWRPRNKSTWPQCNYEGIQSRFNLSYISSSTHKKWLCHRKKQLWQSRLFPMQTTTVSVETTIIFCCLYYFLVIIAIFRVTVTK